MSADFPQEYAEAIHSLGVPAIKDLTSALEKRLKRPGVQVVLLILSPGQEADASSVLTTTQDLQQLTDLCEALRICMADLGKTAPSPVPPNFH